MKFEAHAVPGGWWFGSVLLLGGGVLGFLLALVWNGDGPLAASSQGTELQVSRFAAGDPEYQRLVESNEQIQAALTGIEDVLATLPTWRTPVSEARPAYSEGTKEASAPGASTAQPCSAWVGALNQDISRALLEHGLTPFDPGVPPLVKEAADAYRECTKELSEANHHISELVQSRQLTGELLRREQEVVSGRYYSARSMIFDRLSAGLDALVAVKVDEQ